MMMGKVNTAMYPDLAQTGCRRLARKLCGPGCDFVEGEETCQDKVSHQYHVPRL